jgi:hypothetical protein
MNLLRNLLRNLLTNLRRMRSSGAEGKGFEPLRTGWVPP